MASRYSDVLSPAGGRQPASPPRRPASIRFWARVAFAAQVLFVASWLAAASWQGPRYSVLAQGAVELRREAG
jgi:hypothetical protein